MQAEYDPQLAGWIWNAVPITCRLASDDIRDDVVGEDRNNQVCCFQVPRQSYLFMYTRYVQAKFENQVKVLDCLRFSLDGVAGDFPWFLPIGVIVDKLALEHNIDIASTDSRTGMVLPLKITAHFSMPTKAEDDAFYLPAIRDELTYCNIVYARIKKAVALTYGSGAIAAKQDALQRFYTYFYTAISNNDAKQWYETRRMLEAEMREDASGQRRETCTAVVVHLNKQNREFRVPYSDCTLGEVLHDLVSDSKFRDLLASQTAYERTQRGESHLSNVDSSREVAVVTTPTLMVKIQGIRPYLNTPFTFLADAMLSGDLCLHIVLHI